MGFLQYLDFCLRIGWTSFVDLWFHIYGHDSCLYRRFSRRIGFCLPQQRYYGAWTSLTVGGQYYWTSRLAPKKYARFLLYTTGYLGWAGAVVVSGSVAVGLAQAIVGMIILANPDVHPPSVVPDLRLPCNPGRFSWHIRLSISLRSGSIL